MIPAIVTTLLNTDKFLLRLYRTARRHAVQSVFREESTVDDLTIRPTAKFVMMRTILAVLVFLAVEIAWYAKWRDMWSDNAKLNFVPYVAFVVLLWPLPGAVRRRFTKTTIIGDRLHYETGMFAKTTRTIQLSKLQD